mmetsp:Transcript_129750/g.403535  ORF Transcript_129750/g.403535 Transcript_129750/m.403535 type:complete len:303 (-) Transcript_129750:23-931(-)
MKCLVASSCSSPSVGASFSSSPSAFSTSAFEAAASFSTSSTDARSCTRSREPRPPAKVLAFSAVATASLNSLSASPATSCTSTCLLSRSVALASAFSTATVARSRWSFSNGTPGSSPPRQRRTFATCSSLGSKLYSALAKAASSSPFRKPSLSSSNLSKTSLCALVVLSSLGLFRSAWTATLRSSIFFLQCLSFPLMAMNSTVPFAFRAASDLPISMVFWLTVLVADCTARMATLTAASVAVAASSAMSSVTSLPSKVSGATASTASPTFSSAFASSSKATLASASTFSGSGSGALAGIIGA